MTRQELHSCDVCGAEFKVPETQLRRLRLDEGNITTIDDEVCFECSESFKNWIIQRRKGEAKP
jgi:hypothetical protein